MTLTIAQENALTTDVQDRTWWITGIPSSVGIPGFVRRSYYAPGETAQFSVDYNSAYTFEVWRLGWYGGGDGNSRKVATFAGTPTNQPEAVAIPNSNGAVECSGWSVNVTWSIPSDATPGWYFVLMKNAGSTTFGIIMFCVTDTLAKKPVVVLSSDATWGAAYNYYGGKTAATTGKSVYGSGGPLGDITTRSYCVSYDRPVVTRDGVAQTYFLNAEYPLLRWLERMGIEAGHVTCEQVDADPTVLDGRKIIIVAGHNEYTSQTIWDKFEDLKASTTTRMINLAGNDFFWRTRYGTTDHTQTSTKGRVMWCRKDTMTGPSTHTAGQPIVAGDWGGTWQDTRWTGRTNWSQQLWGDIFTANGIRNDNLSVPFSMKSSPLWRNCSGIQALTTGQTFQFGTGTLGMEWDKPAGSVEKVLMSSTTVDLTGSTSDVNGENYTQNSTPTHSMLLMATPGKGAIFNASNVQFSWVLDNTHDRGSGVSTAEGRQGFLNLVADLGVLPDATSVTAASLTYPTPVSDVASAYGLSDPIDPPPGTSTGSGLEVWYGGEWRGLEIIADSNYYEIVQ